MKVRVTIALVRRITQPTECLVKPTDGTGQRWVPMSELVQDSVAMIVTA